MNQLTHTKIAVGDRHAHVISGGAASDRSLLVAEQFAKVLHDHPGTHIEMLDGLHVPLPDLAEWAKSIQVLDYIAWTDFPAHLPAAHAVLEAFVNQLAVVVVTLEEPW